MNLEKEMEQAMYVDCGSVEEDLFEYVRVAKQYAEEMQKLQNKACAKAYINSFDEEETVSSVVYYNIKNAPLATED